MKDIDRRIERVLMAVVAAAFAAFWLIEFALEDPPEYSSQYLVSAFMVAVIATPWVFAVRILWRAGCARSAAGRRDSDGPARLLDLAVAALPDDRREWGAAMTAELDHVEGSSSRWSFAAGCMRAALFPPRASRAPVLLTLALGIGGAIAAAPVVGRALPEMQVFAAAFILVAGSIATLAVARRGRLTLTAQGPALLVCGVAGIAGSVVSVSSFLARHPDAAKHFPPAVAVTLATALAACLWLVLIPPPGWTSSRLARGASIGAAAALGLGFLVTSRLTIDTLAGPLIWILFAPPPILFAASALAAAPGRSFRAGVQTAVWTALVGALVVFASWLPEAVYRYGLDARLLMDGEMGYSIEENFDDALWMLIAVPVLGFPFGVIGAAAGCRSRAATPEPPAPENSPCRA